MLIRFAADVDALDREGSTPLHVAAKMNEEDIVQLLLEKHADYTKTDIRHALIITKNYSWISHYHIIV